MSEVEATAAAAAVVREVVERREEIRVAGVPEQAMTPQLPLRWTLERTNGFLHKLDFASK